jgi:DNA-binding transcriptional LysR family regulator
MDVLQLKYFIALSQSLNFTDVANRYYVTQPAVSHQIKRLEESLGVRLFFRDKHNVSLTQAGKAFYQHAVAMVDISETAEAQVKHIQEGTEGILRLSCVSSMAKTMVKYLNVFSERYPNVLTEIECVTGLQQIMSINQNYCDLYFSFSSLLENTGELELLPLESDRFSLIIHKTLADKVDITDFSSLKNLPLIAENHADGPYLTRKVFSLCEENNLNPKRVLYYSSFLSVIIALDAKFGFSIFPSRMEEFMPQTLISFPIPGERAIINNAVAWHKRADNFAALKFLEIINESNE